MSERALGVKTQQEGLSRPGKGEDRAEHGHHLGRNKLIRGTGTEAFSSTCPRWWWFLPFGRVRLEAWAKGRVGDWHCFPQRIKMHCLFSVWWSCCYIWIFRGNYDEEFQGLQKFDGQDAEEKIIHVTFFLINIFLSSWKFSGLNLVVLWHHHNFKEIKWLMTYLTGLSPFMDFFCVSKKCSGE